MRIKQRLSAGIACVIINRCIGRDFSDFFTIIYNSSGYFEICLIKKLFFLSATVEILKMNLCILVDVDTLNF